MLYRLEEDYKFQGKRPSGLTKFNITTSKTVKKDESDKSVHIKKIECSNFTITTKPPNNAVLLDNNNIVLISSITCSDMSDAVNNLNFKGKKVTVIGPALDYPSDSTILNIFKVLINKSAVTVEDKFSNIKSKLILLNIFELPGEVGESYAIPILHMN